MKSSRLMRIAVTFGIAVVMLGVLACGGQPAPQAKPAEPAKTTQPAPQAQPAKPAEQPKPAEQAKPAAQPAKPAAAAPSKADWTGQTLKIGQIQPVTGAAAEYGRAQFDGANLAMKLINSEGGVNGAKVEVINKDDATDKAQTIGLIKQFAEDKSVVALIGPTHSANFIATAPVAGELKIPYISAGSGADWPGEFNPYTFRTTAVFKYLTPASMKAAVEKFKPKTAGLIYIADNAGTQSPHDLAVKALTDLGVKIVVDEAVKAGQTNFALQVTKMRDAKPDIIITSTFSAECALFAKQARAARVDAPLVSPHNGLLDPKVYELSEGAAKGLLVPSNFIPTDPRPIVQKFVAKFREEFKREPIALNPYGYDAVYLIADAAKRAGSLTDREKVRDMVGSTKGFEGVAAFYTFEGKGDNTTPNVILMELDKDGFKPLTK